MIKNYFKIAIRNLKRKRAYFFINVIGLALGMACAIMVFSLIKYHSGFDNFHKDKDRIYRFVTEKHQDVLSAPVGYDRSVPAPLGKVFREDYTFAGQVARICTYDEVLVAAKVGNEIKRFKEESFAFTESGYFDIFNFPILEGDKATVLREPNSVIITQRVSKKYFGNRNAIGQTITFDNKISFTVKGILKDLPENSSRKTEIYASYADLKLYDDWLGSDDSWGGISSQMQCFVKLKTGVSVAQVEPVLPAYVKKFRPKSKNVHNYRLQPLADMHFDERFDGVISKQTLWVLAIIGFFLILTACVNFINLATAQALNRSKEVGVRKVLGSVRGQILYQFIVETGLITVIAAVFAFIVAKLALPWVNQLFQSRVSINPFTDWQLVVFIPGLIIAVTLFAGLYPALVLSAFKPITALKNKLTQSNIGGFGARRSLIVSQFIIAQVLIIGMLVIAGQMRYAKKSDLGFRKEAVVMIPTGSQDEKAKTLKNQLQQVSGIEKITLCTAAPASDNNWNTNMRFESRAEEENFRVSDKTGDEDYIETFGLELVAGRNIFPSDTVREFVVNEMIVKNLNLKSPEELIGRNITVGGKFTAPVVGVIRDFHNLSFHDGIGAIFISSNPERYYHYAVKISAANIKTALTAVEKIWHTAYPEQIFEYQFLDEQIASFYKAEETLFRLIRAFSFIAILISCLGLYGLVKFMAAQKTKEIGIRKLLGSSIPQIIWLFGKEFSRLILISFLIAAPLAWLVMSKWLQDFKFRINIGASIFIAALAATFVIAAIAVSFQAIKAALASPVKSLRTE